MSDDAKKVRLDDEDDDDDDFGPTLPEGSWVKAVEIKRVESISRQPLSPHKDAED